MCKERKAIFTQKRRRNVCSKTLKHFIEDKNGCHFQILLMFGVLDSIQTNLDDSPVSQNISRHLRLLPEIFQNGLNQLK